MIDGQLDHMNEVDIYTGDVERKLRAATNVLVSKLKECRLDNVQFMITGSILIDDIDPGDIDFLLNPTFNINDLFIALSLKTNVLMVSNYTDDITVLKLLDYNIDLIYPKHGQMYEAWVYATKELRDNSFELKDKEKRLEFFEDKIKEYIVNEIF